MWFGWFLVRFFFILFGIRLIFIWCGILGVVGIYGGFCFGIGVGGCFY